MRTTQRHASIEKLVLIGWTLTIVAATFAESKISELIASGEWEQGGLSRGNFGHDYPDYVWDIDVKNWDEAPMSELRVSVYWDGGEYKEGQCVTLTTLVYTKDE